MDIYTAFVKNTHADNFQLVYFAVPHNSITHILNNQFKHLIYLKYLYLHNNLISTIQSDVFKYNKDLDFIQLSTNKISVFHLELNTLQNLRFFSIYSNRLTVLKENLFKNFISNTNNLLKVYDNMFICDREMDWLTNMTGEIKPVIIIKKDSCSCSFNGLSVDCFIKKTYLYGNCVVETIPICNNG